MIKKIFVTLMSLVILGSLGYSSVLAYSMYEKYNQTIDWKSSSLLSNIHQVPPSLAKNYIYTEDEKELQILVDINSALDEIKADGEIKDEKYDKYWSLHDEVESVIKETQNDTLLNTFNDFSLYLKIDSAIKKAYDEINIEDLEKYAEILVSRLSKDDNNIEHSFLNKLHEISNDYKELNVFSKNAINKLGIIENKVLYVDAKVNRSMTDDLLNEIEEKNLIKFAHIKNLVEKLKGGSWEKILTHNNTVSEYYSWKESERILNALLYSNYVSVSSFKTVEDVLNYNPSISLENKENHSIDNSSSVTAVYYNETQLNEDLYVKRGTSLNFKIDYKYIENPKSTVIFEYVDISGNKIANNESQIGYVGSSINVNVKDIDGYKFIKIRDNLDKFPEQDSTIQIYYDKYIPKPEPEPTPDLEENEVHEDNLDNNDE